ncbi:MAG TPA: protein kinase [Oscillospiraceae bacterium]|nr:protein kinase [Oscillospiraceae bacterium]
MDTDLLNEKLYIDGKQIDIDNYRVIKLLGYGANADVYLVKNTLLLRLEAMKVWKPRKRMQTVDATRFKSEVIKNSKFSHPNIAAFYHAGIYSGSYIAFLEYCKGTTLEEYMRNAPSYLNRLSLLYQIAWTMNTVYACGCYHGDLHSKNILVDCEKIKILDFGTSIFAHSAEDSHKRDAKMLYQLSIEVLPELKSFTFYSEKMIEKPSIDICNCILGLIYLLCFEANDSGDQPFDSYLIILAEIMFSCPGFDLNEVIEYVHDDRFIEILNLCEQKKSEIIKNYKESTKSLGSNIEQLISEYNSIIFSRESFKTI